MDIRAFASFCLIQEAYLSGSEDPGGLQRATDGITIARIEESSMCR